jgi:hypothetical protein
VKVLSSRSVRTTGSRVQKCHWGEQGPWCPAVPSFSYLFLCAGAYATPLLVNRKKQFAVNRFPPERSREFTWGEKAEQIDGIGR